MRTLFDTRVKVFSSLATSDERYYKEPMELASLQGKIFGIRSVMEGFFGALRTEHKRRLARAAAPKSNG
jgi:hypothetical protein